MSWLDKRRNIWMAVWTVNGRRVRKSTVVHVSPVPGEDDGFTAVQLRKIAQTSADAMEAADRGLMTEEMAVAAVRAALAARGRGKPAETIRQFSERWLENRRGTKSHERSAHAVRRLLLGIGSAADLSLASFTPAMAADWAQRELLFVSGSTVARRIEEISCMWNRAIAEGITAANPWRGLRLPAAARAEKTEREIFTREELAVIFSFPGEWPDLTAACLLLGGLRLGEAALLRWDQIDTQNHLIRLRTQKTNRGMTKPIIPPLRALLEHRRGLGLWRAEPHIFPCSAARIAEAGGQTTKLSREFGMLLERHGLRGPEPEKPRALHARRIHTKSFHSLRGTAVTFLLDCGCPPEMVRHIVGHDDPRIETAHYYKPAPGAAAPWLARLADGLGIGTPGA